MRATRISPRKGLNVKAVQSSLCNAAASIVFVGRNRHGNWIAREQNGIFGGLFANRTQAFKYALFENGRHPEAIVEVLREIELDIPATRRSGGT